MTVTSLLTFGFIGDKKNIAKLPKHLPLFFVAGKDDPVGGQGKMVTKIYETYRDSGITDISFKLYPNDRHEILNELDRFTVYSDIYEWLERQLLKLD